MFCRHCGKEIAEDSKFCKYCGKAAEELNEDGASEQAVSENKSEEGNGKVEVVLTTDKDNPVQVEISHKPIIKKVTFANEVIANIKMIGTALLLWIVYIIGFSIYRIGDISTTTDYGASCYDRPMSGSSMDWEWERHYAKDLEVLLFGGFRKELDWKLLPYDARVRECERLAKEKKCSEEFLEHLKIEAKKKAEAQRKAFMDQVYSDREYRFENEREEHMKWSAIILLLLTVVGRYIINFFKWVLRTADSQ